MTSFLQHPSVQYCLIMVLGSYGVYVAMPIDLDPQSTVEWIDLVINIIIFIPSSLIAIIGGLLAIYCAVVPNQIDGDGRFAGLANMVLRNFGIRRLLLSEFVSLGPLRVFIARFRTLFGKNNEQDT